MLLICITIKDEAFKRVLIVFTYRKIPKISPGAYIFERPFWRSLFLEGLIYGGKFASQNRLGYPYSWKKIYSFWFVLLCIWGQFPSTSPPGGLYLEGQFNRGFFALRVWGAYTWRGLFSEFYCIDIYILKPCYDYFLSLYDYRYFYLKGNFWDVI